MKKLSAMFVAVCLLNVSTVHAEECTAAIPLTSPCSGILLPPSSAQEALRCLEVDLPRLSLELKREKDVCQIRLSAMNLRIEALQNHNNELGLLLESALENQEPVSFEWSSGLWAATGFVVGAALTVTLAFAVSTSTN